MNKQWIREGVSLKTRAKRAWRFRHDKRIEARSFMPNKLEVEMLELRDIDVYGTPDGPTFEFLVERLRSDGLKGNALFEAIIKGAYRTNTGVDKTLGF
jgi:hypothetical protein